jgi:hypothetical protein
MEYIVDGRKFGFSYSDLRETYNSFIWKTDEEFLDDLPAALHFACFVCFFKEIPSYICLADTGIVHELVHLLQTGKYGATTNLQEVRQLFEDQLKLA